MVVDAYSQDVLNRIYNVHWADEKKSQAILSLIFSATPTGLYKDGTPTIVTLSVESLPPLSPSTFEVNWPEGIAVPPFFDAVYYGGRTELTMPDGESGTLTANWRLEQRFADGAAVGQVVYNSSAEKPFLGVNTIQLKVVMNLRPLDFLSIASADNHYAWQASPVVGIPGMSPDDNPKPKSGRAETGATLTFTLDVIMDPPGATFTAGSG